MRISLPRPRLGLRAFFVILTLVTLPVACNRTGVDVTPEEANRELHQDFAVPDDASNVRFNSDATTSYLVAKISRESVEEWCADKGWGLRPIKEEDTALFRGSNDDGSVDDPAAVSDGFILRSEEGECSFYGVYASETGMISIMYYCR